MKGRRAESGTGMDKVVAATGLSQRTKIAIGAAAVLLLALLFWWFAPSAGSQTRGGRAADHLGGRARARSTISCRCGRGSSRWSPSISTRSRAAGSRRCMVEDGAMVQQGQLLAVLSNSDLAAQPARPPVGRVARGQLDAQPGAGARPDQHRRRARGHRGRSSPPTRPGASTRCRSRSWRRASSRPRSFNDSRDEYLSNQRRADVLRRARAINQRLQSSQLAQLRASNASLSGSLDIARATLDALNLRAPVAGQLTAFSIQVGQSLNRGERLGQVDSAGRNKLVASVDEYLSRPGPAGPDRHRRDPAARPIGPRSPKSIRRSATACSRSTSPSSAPSRRRSTAARPCRPS